MPLRNWQQHAEPASAPPAIDGARETEQPVLPRGRVLGVNECVSQGLSSQKRHPAELDNVHQLIYEMCGRRRLQVPAWLRPADAAALLLDGRKVLAHCTTRTPSPLDPLLLDYIALLLACSSGMYLSYRLVV